MASSRKQSVRKTLAASPVFWSGLLVGAGITAISGSLPLSTLIGLGLLITGLFAFGRLAIGR